MAENGTRSMERALVWDGDSKTWMTARRKIGAVVTRMGYGFVLKKAENNTEEVRERGQEEEDATTP